MKFSVLLSIYSKELPTLLQQCFNSILNQTLLPDEIILVKDGPLTNELDSVIAEYSSLMPMLKIIPLNENQGLGKALNEGLKHCSNDLVARMDTDDICKPNRFEKQINIFKENPEIDVVGSWVDEFIDTTDNVLSVKKLPKNHNDIFKYGKSRNPINHPSVMFRKSAVISAGGYQHFPLFEDYYLWVRMLLNGAKFYNIQESLLYFRASEKMFMRRGGFSYAKIEVKFLWKIHTLGYIGILSTFKNIIIRFTVRIMPNSIRGWAYKKLLRK